MPKSTSETPAARSFSASMETAAVAETEMRAMRAALPEGRITLVVAMGSV